jgi:hypothetical protein
MVDTLGFAKILNQTGESCGLDRDVYHAEIEKRAEAIRAPGMSREQAYTKVITETPAGKELLKAYRSAPVAKPPVEAAQDLPERPEPAGEASKELERMAAAESKRTGKSFAIAYTALLTSPEHRELASRVKREELSATRMVRDSRAPLLEAERESLTESWVGDLDAVGRRKQRPWSQ